jgi:UDPglucose--hexose-1-phosphate uridylyltransferase
MELRSERVEATILDPRHGFQPAPAAFEVRWDPLTAHTARILDKSNLLPPSDFDLEAFARETRQGCFFCPEKVFDVTPKLLPEIHLDGRIRRGEALLFPNIQPYAKHSSVAIYGPELHYLPLDRMDARVVGDNLAAQVEFVQAVQRFDAAASWSSLSANHMLPSGSSLFHPHTQAAVDAHPTTMQALLAQVSAETISDYLETERRLGARHLGRTGRVEWLTSFAPVGFNEIRAFIPGAGGVGDLSGEDVVDLASGLAAALNLYAELGFQSFNWALYGGTVLNLRLVTRSNLKPLYRSDAAYFERLHWQGMVDTSPEELAERARGRFG